MKNSPKNSPKNSRWKAICLFGALFASGLVVSAAWAAAPSGAAPSAAARKEAGERFDRGVRLFNQGENAGALVEFKRAFELTSDPRLLFNMGLVYGELKRPVEAVDALDRLLASQAPLSADQRAKARRARAEQWASIAFIKVTTSVPAVIDLDGVEIARTPTSTAVRVAAGTHLVGAVAAGYPPTRRTIDIAGGETQNLAFDLVPSESTFGHLAVKTALPGAQVWIDGKQAGQTPLASTLALTPGLHHVELRRDGYRSAAGDVRIDIGASAEMTLNPELDAAATVPTGQLALAASEPDALVSVDGGPAALVVASVRLTAGAHHLVVTRGGFEPAEADVEVSAGATSSVKVRLEPTAETHAAYLARVHERRVWGFSLVGGGGVALVTGIVLVATGKSALDSANVNLAAVEKAAVKMGGGMCDPAMLYDPIKSAACQAMLDDANQRVSNANLRITLGYVAGGVGIAGAVVGAALLLSGDDPGRYEHLDKVSGAVLTGWAQGNAGGLLLTGRF